MKYTLSNWDIKGTLNTYDNKVLVLWIVTNGSYEKDKLELDNIINANFINSMFWYAKNTRNSKRVSDLSNLSKMTEMYITKNWMLPSSESFWEEMGINKDDFQDPIANVEINGCKFGYTYAKWNNSYQFSSCTEWSDIKITKWNYYEWKDDKLANREYLEWYTAWGKQDTQEKETPIININLIYDSVWNNFNQNLYLDTIYEWETIFEFNMKNIGIIEYKKIDIQTPTNTVPFEEVFETNNNY